ncbi:MAG: DedA family protein [Agarilytica sp.]
MQSLLELSNNPVFLFFAIIVIAWIWEDAALISGALLAADTRLDVGWAVLAVFVGICSGDLALYYLGRLGHRWRPLRKWILTNPNSRALSKRFRRSTMTNIFVIRFIPGLRTIGFTLCGLWKITFRRFFIAMASAGIFWIAIVFTLVYQLGTSTFLEGSHWKWSLIGLALLLFVFNNFWVHRHAKRSKH